MPKMKTSSSAKKRFKRISKRKVKRSKAYRRHLLTKKGAKRRRDLRKSTFVSGADIAKILILLPN